MSCGCAMWASCIAIHRTCGNVALNHFHTQMHANAWPAWICIRHWIAIDNHCFELVVWNMKMLCSVRAYVSAKLLNMQHVGPIGVSMCLFAEHVFSPEGWPKNPKHLLCNTTNTFGSHRFHNVVCHSQMQNQHPRCISTSSRYVARLFYLKPKEHKTH